MAAKIEFHMFLKGDVSLQRIFSLLEMEGLHVTIKTMMFFDDWEYTNQTPVDPSFMKEFPERFLFQKFTLTNFIVDTCWECVLVTSSIHDIYLELLFALDSKKVVQYAKENVENWVKNLYSKIIDSIISSIQKEGLKDIFVGACMGIECAVQFEGDILAAINETHGATHWILPAPSGADISLKSFSRDEKDGVIIFSSLGGIGVDWF